MASTSAPSINGTITSQNTSSNGSLSPFANVTLTDPVNGSNVLTITITKDAKGKLGTLSDGKGFKGKSTLQAGTTAGIYTLTGSAADITTELASLVYTPNDPASATNASYTSSFSLSDVGNGYSAPTYNKLYDFGDGSQNANGANPDDGLISDGQGDLFGTTFGAGGLIAVALCLSSRRTQPRRLAIARKYFIHSRAGRRMAPTLMLA